MSLTIGSLFSGIGGLELGLERAGFGPVVWQCEADPFAREILARHWPSVPCIRDVRDVSPLTVEPADLICGGFPCQDLSVAGKGAGLDGERSGLWREFLRVIDECQPGAVIVENVAHGRSRWLPTVCADLEELGYVPAPILLPASAVGAPHERARVFVVADPYGICLRQLKQRTPARRPAREVRDPGESEPLDASRDRRASGASPWASLPDLGRMGNGVSPGLDDPADHTDRIRVLGNAVVPQVAEAIGRFLMEVL